MFYPAYGLRLKLQYCIHLKYPHLLKHDEKKLEDAEECQKVTENMQRNPFSAIYSDYLQKEWNVTPTCK